ncbi:glycosyltransferase family 9 protein [Candidatus Omnitrophota bacterium]
MTINKVLFFTLSNFGDVILSLPVLDVLRSEYPKALITVMVGPRASEVFQDNPYINELIIYDKYVSLKEKIRLFFRLKKERFDLVIDLRNSLYGALLPARFKTSPFLHPPANIRHMKQRNLYRLRAALKQNGLWATVKERVLYTSPEDKKYLNALLQDNGINPKDRIIIVSPATGGRTRRWARENFIELCKKLAADYPVVLVGRKQDKPLSAYIQSKVSGRVFDFSGLTSLAQLVFLLEKSSLVVVCDTGILQLASYLDIPIVALFGPSDEHRYGPWSGRFKLVSAKTACRPCTEPDCRFKTNECMHKISVEQVLDSIDELMKL